MNQKSLLYKSITYYSRYYKLIAVAALITVAVIVGSLVIGDSVRTTLVNQVKERLGETETVVFSRNSYMSDGLLNKPLFKGSSRGIILMNGFVSQNGRLLPVFVWGVDDMDILRGKTKMNPSLAKELALDGQADIILRLPAAGLVPSGSLFVTENYTTSMRLVFGGVVAASDGGNISLKNEQILPFNIFINRQELAEALEVEGKVNLILSDQKITDSDFSEVWDYTSSGLSVNERGEDFEITSERIEKSRNKFDRPGNIYTEITSDRVFLQKEVVASILENNSESDRIFSYMANSIALGDASIPYSFVTAVDRYEGETLQPDEIFLSDYAAKRINAKTGDRVDVSYFVSQDLKTLQTKSIHLKVKKIVPISKLVADGSLSADYPGLSDVDRCTDWDSDLPIDMSLITDEDERYWELYKSTPKAILPFEAVANDWGNDYGNATAICVAGENPDLDGLTANMFGIQLLHPRETGIYAAKNGVDFSSLFLALGFFIIVSAMLLMLIPLSGMFFARKNELILLKCLGYPRKRITKILWSESVPVVLVSSIVGVVAGLVYTCLVMWLLGNVWKGATHTDGFSVYPGMLTMITGLVVGTGLSLLLLRVAIARSLGEKAVMVGAKDTQPYGAIAQLLNRKKAVVKVKTIVKKKKTSIHRRGIIALICSLLSMVIIGINFMILHSVELFVLVGILLIATAAAWGDWLLCRKGTDLTNGLVSSNSPVSSKGIVSTKETISTNSPVHPNGFGTAKLVWNTLYANKKQAMLSFFTLAIGVFIVFSVGLNRRGFADSSQVRTGTGGYALWMESSVPVYHNMMTDEGRAKLSLAGLPADADIMQCLRFSADDASCLNLNKVANPTVLGVDMDALMASDFQISQNIYSSGREGLLGEMQQHNGNIYPALIDETVLTWGLMMKLGDTLVYENDKGYNVSLHLVGTLANSIFQGNVLIDRNLFREIWPETTGSDIFLIKVDESDREQVKNLFSSALYEYGVTVTTTNDRLKQFNAVTDTYLTIFLTLGGLGLLLGIMGFVIVVRKNLTMRQDEIRLYGMLGFTKRKISKIMYKENILVPLYAILTGVISSLVGVNASFMNIGKWIWVVTLLFTLLFIICVLVFVQKSVINVIKEININCQNA